MSRFDVFPFKSGEITYLVDVQANLLSSLGSRVVLPLIPLSTSRKEVVSRLKPIVKVQGKDYVLMTTDIGVVATKSLGEPIANLSDSFEYEIINAIDFLFQGF